jgi:hypothetical protein
VDTILFLTSRRSKLRWAYPGWTDDSTRGLDQSMERQRCWSVLHDTDFSSALGQIPGPKATVRYKWPVVNHNRLGFISSEIPGSSSRSTKREHRANELQVLQSWS